MITDWKGNLIWMENDEFEQAMNFQVQKYKGEDFLTFWHKDTKREKSKKDKKEKKKDKKHKKKKKKNKDKKPKLDEPEDDDEEAEIEEVEKFDADDDDEGFEIAKNKKDKSDKKGKKKDKKKKHKKVPKKSYVMVGPTAAQFCFRDLADSCSSTPHMKLPIEYSLSARASKETPTNSASPHKALP